MVDFRLALTARAGGVHLGVHDLLGEPAKQPLHISMAPLSKRGMASMSGVGSDKISIAVFVLS